MRLTTLQYSVSRQTKHANEYTICPPLHTMSTGIYLTPSVPGCVRCVMTSHPLRGASVLPIVLSSVQPVIFGWDFSQLNYSEEPKTESDNCWFHMPEYGFREHVGTKLLFNEQIPSHLVTSAQETKVPGNCLCFFLLFPIFLSVVF